MAIAESAPRLPDRPGTFKRRLSLTSRIVAGITLLTLSGAFVKFGAQDIGEDESDSQTIGAGVDAALSALAATYFLHGRIHRIGNSVGRNLWDLARNPKAPIETALQEGHATTIQSTSDLDLHSTSLPPEGPLQ